MVSFFGGRRWQPQKASTALLFSEPKNRGPTGEIPLLTSIPGPQNNRQTRPETHTQDEDDDVGLGHQQFLPLLGGVVWKTCGGHESGRGTAKIPHRDVRQACGNKYIQTHASTHARTHAHTHAGAHACTLTHINTHTHTLNPTQSQAGGEAAIQC